MRSGLAYVAACLLSFVACLSSSCSSDSSSPSSAEGGSAGTGAAGEGAGAVGAEAGGGAGGAGSGSLDWFAAWELARDALRRSPDHLKARADALVAEGDPERIFAFVRDDILTYPATPSGFQGALSVTRWGTRATLRGGAGTPREKAELLVELYERAGFTAEVVQGTPDPAKLDGHKVLLRTSSRAFEAKLSPEELQGIQSALGTSDPGPREAIDADGAQASELSSSLLALLPTELEAPFDFTLPVIPLVRVKIAGQWTYANPLGPDAAFGDSLTLATPTGTGSAGAAQKVHVLLEGARASAPYERFELVEQTYDASDVAGRRIQLAFPPPVAIKTLSQMRIQDVATVVPVLSVVGPDLSHEDAERLAVTGSMLSLGGDVYEKTAAGVSVNGRPLVEAISDPSTVAKVSSVTARAPGVTYPRISVTVSAFDENGNTVPGLAAGAFEVEEDGVPVSFTVTRNQAPAPRVVLLFDASTSLPADFRGASAVTLGNQIVESLYGAYPDAQVRVATIDFGAIFVDTVWATTLAAAKTQVQGLEKASGSSEIWQALYEVERQSPTVIILVTDGAATDNEEARYESALAAGAPVLSIGVGTVEQSTLSEISAVSGGEDVIATMQQEAIDAALAEIEARAREDYVITYGSPPSSATEHTVTVTVNGQSSEVSYGVPDAPVLPDALAGLYLTLGVNGKNETLPIAGFSLGFSSAFPEITQAMLDDVRSQLLGRISISVEGAAPTASEVLDDWLSDKLSLRPLWQALSGEDDDSLLAALGDGIHVTPTKLLWSQAPLPNAASAEALTFETGPRVAALLHKTRAEGPVSRQLDFFPLSRWATAADDPRDAWERTLRATAALAVTESELFSGTSTLEALAGVKLTSVAAGHARDQAGLSATERLAWTALEAPFNSEYQLLVPEKPGAFWAVHAGSGTVLGILPDGTGGGAEDICSDYHLTSAYLQGLGLLGSLAGVSVGGWVGLAQWEVDSVTMATLVIGYGAQAQDIKNPGIVAGCNILSEGAGNKFSPYGAYDAIAGTVNVISPDHQLPTPCSGINICQ